MNLVDMATRGDQNLLLEADFVGTSNGKYEFAKGLVPYLENSYILTAKRKIDGILYRGFDLSADRRTRLVLRSPLAWHPFRQRPDGTGWGVVAIDRCAEGSKLAIRLKDRATGEVTMEDSVSLLRTLSSIRFPCPFGLPVNISDSDLELTFNAERGGKAFLAVHRVLDRSEAIDLCRGHGIELGPGLQPQVLPSANRDVVYVERSSPEEWNRLYNEERKLQIDRALWSRYTIGHAYPLPVADESLDFIFSSHVFEHLANPLGHLTHWATKLRSGGIVVGIVPDVAGSKDYVFEPCALEDLFEEYKAGNMEPTLNHYQRWAKYRAPGKDPAEYLKANRSIHVHFYTHHNMASLLNLAVQRLGYSWFNIRHTPNHKDFHFVVGK